MTEQDHPTGQIAEGKNSEPQLLSRGILRNGANLMLARSIRILLNRGEYPEQLKIIEDVEELFATDDAFALYRDLSGVEDFAALECAENANHALVPKVEVFGPGVGNRVLARYHRNVYKGALAAITASVDLFVQDKVAETQQPTLENIGHNLGIARNARVLLDQFKEDQVEPMEGYEVEELIEAIVIREFRKRFISFH